VALVTLHPIQAAAVHRHDGALHINQIILAQALSFPNKDCATFRRSTQPRPLAPRLLTDSSISRAIAP
jgi:hypothetical protein